MFPVLLTFDKIAVSSYGVFLSIGFLLGLFLIWRLSRAWDLNEEKVLDLSLLTFLGGLIGARLYFVFEHFQFFAQNILSIIFFYKAPGFSFWGAFLGGFLTLHFLAKRKRVNFWEISDIASIGFLTGLILSNIGCFLAGCSIGIKSDLFFAAHMAGALGKRFPVQILEALLLFIVLLKLWSKSLHFHQRGKILSLSLISIGAVKLLTEGLKASHDESIYLSAVLVILGLNILIKVTKRDLRSDLKNFVGFIGKLFKDPEMRKNVIAGMQKYWYNQKTSISWKFKNLKKTLSLTKILRRFNVRLSYKNDKLY